jgi:hypothetical protein
VEVQVIFLDLSGFPGYSKVMEEVVIKTSAIAEYVMSRLHSTTVRVQQNSGTITLRENDEPQKKICRVGFLEGKITVPSDFDTMGQDTIAALFEGSV